MMKKSVIFLSILFSIFLIVSAHSQEEMVVVDGDSFENQRRPSAAFRHDDHNDTAEICCILTPNRRKKEKIRITVRKRMLEITNFAICISKMMNRKKMITPRLIVQKKACFT